MTIEENRTAENEAAIRELIDGFVKAIRAKDIKGVMSVFAPEVVSFDIGPPLQHGGGETFIKFSSVAATFEKANIYVIAESNSQCGASSG